MLLMSHVESPAHSRQATESQPLDIASRPGLTSWISALHRFPLSRLAFLIVGIIGVAMIVAGRAGWMPGLNGNVGQAGMSASGSARTDSAARSPESSNALETEANNIAETPRPTPTPILHTVREGESLLVIAANHGVAADLIARANDLWDPNRLRVGQTLIIPSPGYLVEAATSEKPGELRMWWPLQGDITTYFGEEERYYISGAHTGMDIAANVGVPVRAAADGKVVVAWKRPDNVGWHIVLDHGDGWSTLYGHLSEFAVDEGDTVERGQVIGAAGNTGFSFGPHLHFEIRRWGVPLDPLKYLP